MSILTCYRAYCAHGVSSQPSCITVVKKECDADGCKETGSSSVCGSTWKILQEFKAYVKGCQHDEITVVTASSSGEVNGNHKFNLVEVGATHPFKEGLRKVQSIQLTNVPEFFVKVALENLEK